MSIVGFLCPDKQQILIEDCFKECRLGHRCMTLPSLMLISGSREWAGVASTTQLLNGTMEEFLKLTKPYYVDPDKRVFMLQGILHHKSLEQAAKELGMAAEIPLNFDRDIFDLLEWEGKKLGLTDYKKWGSYRVAKALGIVEVGRQPDPSGAVYKSSGKWGKAGSSKMVPIWEQHPDKADNWEAEYQLNRYRIMIKAVSSLEISWMQLQVSVRDGGLYIAKDRGVFRNNYNIPIPILPDEMILQYFGVKNMNLMEALDKGHWNTPCSVAECWEGVKCRDWCDVWVYCPKGLLVRRIGG